MARYLLIWFMGLCLNRDVLVSSDSSMLYEVLDGAKDVSASVTRVCEETGAVAELPTLCEGAAAVWGATYVVEVVVNVIDTRQKLSEQQESDCSTVWQDIDEMNVQFNQIAKSVKRWKPLLHNQQYRDLFVETEDVLGIGHAFLKSTRHAIDDVQGLDLSLVQRSGSSQSVPGSVPAFVLLGSLFSLVRLDLGNIGDALVKGIVPLGAGVLAVTMQGCADGDDDDDDDDYDDDDEYDACDRADKHQIRGHLMGIERNMGTVMTYIKNLKDCVPKGKPVCSADEMKIQVGEIQSGIKAVYDEMQQLVNMESRLAAIAGDPSALVASKSSARIGHDSFNASFHGPWSKARIDHTLRENSSVHLAQLQIVPEADLTKLINDFKNLSSMASKGARRHSLHTKRCSQMVCAIGNGWSLGVSAVIFIAMMAYTGCCKDMEHQQDYMPLGDQRRSLVMFLTFAVCLVLLSAGQAFQWSICSECGASPNRAHELQMLSTFAEELHSNVRAQFLCAQVKCSETAHLQVQFMKMARDTVNLTVLALRY